LGIGLALVCIIKGYKFTAVMSKVNTSERWMILKALGANAVLVPQAKGGTLGQVTKRISNSSRREQNNLSGCWKLLDLTSFITMQT
jgi:cysteine synthase A